MPSDMTEPAPPAFKFALGPAELAAAGMPISAPTRIRAARHRETGDRRRALAPEHPSLPFSIRAGAVFGGIRPKGTLR